MARKGAMRKVYKIFVGKPEGKEGLEDQSLDMTEVIRWVLNEGDGKVWSGCMWLRVEEVMGSHKMGQTTRLAVDIFAFILLVSYSRS